MLATAGLLLGASLVLGYAAPSAAADPSPRGYAVQRYADGGVVRWNPCRRISYRANTTLAPRGAMRDVHAAVGEVSRATGIAFAYRGSSHVTPDNGFGWRGSAPRVPRPLVIAWARPGRGPGRSGLLQPRLAGVGAAVSATWRDTAGAVHPPQIVTGLVVINARYNRRLHPGFTGSGSRGLALMHELGHAMGLGHVRAQQQVMNPVLGKRHGRWGAGDLAGLRTVGRPAGCLR